MFCIFLMAMMMALCKARSKWNAITTITQRLDFIRQTYVYPQIEERFMRVCYYFVEEILKPFAKIQFDSTDLNGFYLNHSQLEINYLTQERYYHAVIHSEHYDLIEHIFVMKTIGWKLISVYSSNEAAMKLPCLYCSFGKTFVYHYKFETAAPVENRLLLYPCKTSVKTYILSSLWKKENDFFISWIPEEVLLVIFETLEEYFDYEE